MIDKINVHKIQFNSYWISFCINGLQDVPVSHNLPKNLNTQNFTEKELNI